MGMNPATKGSSRVFIIEGRARADHVPVYRSCLRAGAQDLSAGDVSNIECPDPDKYNSWIPVGQIQGQLGRPTSDLQGRYALDEESYLLRITKARCAIDVQVHYGECASPSDFNTFTKIKVYPNALLSNHSTDEEGSLGSDGQGEINETSALSAEDVYEILPLKFAERGGAAVVNPIVDVVICDTVSCGDCDEESDGCEKIYAVDDGLTGSPGTQPDLVWSLDKGATFDAENIDSLVDGETTDGLACLGIYVVVVSNADGGLHYKERSLIGDGSAWTRNALGIVVGSEPNDIWSVGTYAFIVGDTGYVYGTTDPTITTIVLDAGVAVTDNLNAVHAINDQFAVAVGENGAVIYTENQVSWQAATVCGANNLLCIWVKSETEWWCGDSGGVLYYTLDKGVTWTIKALPGAGWTLVNDIQFGTNSVGHIVADKAATGHALQSFDGGNSWIEVPNLVGALPTVTSLVALAACKHDVNFVVDVGTNGTDGIIIVGED